MFFFQAVNLHYWATNNLEWYDPAAITTKNGSLVITFSEKETHNLQYQGGEYSAKDPNESACNLHW